MKTVVSKTKKVNTVEVQQPKTTSVSVPSKGQDMKTIVPAAPTKQDIAKRAYEIYVRNGYTQGQCEQNWSQAEQELKTQN